MTIAEALLADFDYEMSNTRKLLERIPDGNPAWKPHEKSFPMGKLAMHVATMPQFGVYILEDDGMDLAKPIHPHMDLTFRTRDTLLSTFDTTSAALRTALAGASDQHMLATWPFSFGEHSIFNESRLMTFRVMCFNHMIHHRAQLGVYLRLNDVPVPGLYGPSADEPFGA